MLEENPVLEDVCFSNGIKLIWSNGKTNIGSRQSVDSEACIEKYTLNEEVGTTVIITGCEGTVKEMQLISTKYGQVSCRIHLDGRVETIYLDRVSIDPAIAVGNPDFEDEFPEGGAAMATQVPTDVLLKVVVYLSPSFKEKATSLGYSDATTLAKQIFSHTSLAFQHESWGDTKIHLKANYQMLPVETSSIDVWRHIVPENQQKVGKLHCMLLGEAMIGRGLGDNGQNSTLGIAFPSSVCGKKHSTFICCQAVV